MIIIRVSAPKCAAAPKCISGSLRRLYQMRRHLSRSFFDFCRFFHNMNLYLSFQKKILTIWLKTRIIVIKKSRKTLLNHTHRRITLNTTITPKNYTDEMVATLVSSYATKEGSNKEFVEHIANELGRTSKSIVAKLVSLNLYKTEAKTTKTGVAVISKAELVGMIEQYFDMELPSFVKATKQDLQTLVDNLDLT